MPTDPGLARMLKALDVQAGMLETLARRGRGITLNAAATAKLAAFYREIASFTSGLIAKQKKPGQATNGRLDDALDAVEDAAKKL